MTTTSTPAERTIDDDGGETNSKASEAVRAEARKRKKDRRSAQKASEAAQVEQAAATAQPTKSSLKASAKASTKSRSKSSAKAGSKSRSKSRSEASDWMLTRRIGGKFSNLGEVFSKDERHCFLATRSSVQVCSATSGDTQRTLQPALSSKRRDGITAVLLDTDNEYRLIVLTLRGLMITYDWTDGAVLSKVELDADEVHTAALIGDLVVWSDSLGINAAEKSTGRHERSIKQMSDCLSVIAAGGRLWAWTSQHVVIMSLEDGKVVREETVSFGRPAMTFAASAKHFAWSDEHGALYVKPTRPVGENGSTPARKLHWHALLISGMAFALDGEYLLTGGAEGVLVFWQMSTSNKQFLPRVGRAIETVSVSPTSRLYALKLDDNAVKLIGATDLALRAEPTALRHDGGKLQMVCANGNLLLSTGVEVQTWDLATSRTSSRITVARETYAGAVHRGKGYSVNEPQLTSHAAIDGWLATVDAWQAPTEDLADYGLLKPVTETQLKFWRWDKATGRYAIVTRIDAPHGRHAVAQVLALHDRFFVSIGDDAGVKFWRRRAARKDDVSAAADGAQHAESWVCYRNLSLTQGTTKCRAAVSPDSSLLALGVDKLVYVIDAATGVVKSTIAGLGTGKLVGLGFVKQYLVLLGPRRLVSWHLIQCEAVWSLDLPQNVRLSLAVGDDASDAFAVAVDETGLRSTEISKSGDRKKSKSRTSATSPAGNERDDGGKKAKHDPKLYIFSPSQPKPLYRAKSERLHALAYSAEERCFVALSYDLELLLYGRTRQTAVETRAVPEVEDGLSAIYPELASGASAAVAANGAAEIGAEQADGLESDMQRLVINAQSLEGIFNGEDRLSLDEKMEALAELLLGARVQEEQNAKANADAVSEADADTDAADEVEDDSVNSADGMDVE